MRFHTHVAFVVAAALLATSCSLFQGGVPTPPLPSSEALATQPTDGSTAGPTTVVNSPSPVGQTLFVSAGQLWAIGLDGSGQEPLTALPEGSVIRNLAVSLDGHYAAFTVNGSQVMVHDLQQNQTTLVDSNGAGVASQLVWPPTSNALYFHRAAPGDSGAIHSKIIRAAIPPGDVADVVTDHDLSNDSGLLPLFGLGDGMVLAKSFTLDDLVLGGYALVGPDGTTTSIGEGFGFWDVLNGKALLYKTDQYTSGQRSAPVALWIADLSGGQLSNLQQISPADDPAAYLMAHFSPDGSRVVAIKSAMDASGNWIDSLVMIPPALNGAVVDAFAQDTESQVVSFSIVDNEHVVVQRLRNGQPELWVLSLDGTADRLLTSGEQPQVVGGR